MNEFFELKLISDETKEESYDYDERVRIYECPCGKGTVIWSKERPNGKGFGYQATFSDTTCLCKDCESKYEFRGGRAKIKE